MALAINSWRAVKDEVLNRIHSRHWPPGALIPAEADLADEFGCARSTVNRALRELADSGLLDRRRKAGTRVKLNPESRAQISIPIIRLEIENFGGRHRFVLLSSKKTQPPPNIRARMGLLDNSKLVHTTTLHFADEKPHVLEDRWINPRAVPHFSSADLSSISVNEWLVQNVPFTNGDIALGASRASKLEAELFSTRTEEALFTVERTTWQGDEPITTVRLTYRSGYQLRMSI